MNKLKLKLTCVVFVFITNLDFFCRKLQNFQRQMKKHIRFNKYKFNVNNHVVIVAKVWFVGVRSLLLPSHTCTSEHTWVHTNHKLFILGFYSDFGDKTHSKLNVLHCSVYSEALTVPDWAPFSTSLTQHISRSRTFTCMFPEHTTASCTFTELRSVSWFTGDAGKRQSCWFIDECFFSWSWQAFLLPAESC